MEDSFIPPSEFFGLVSYHVKAVSGFITIFKQ